MAEIEGTFLDDTLTGLDGEDNRINALPGDDLVNGGDQKDFITGDRGDDRVFGNKGDDTIFGQAGRDYLDGGEGDDQIDGGIDFDTVLGGSGNDTLAGGRGKITAQKDIVSGGSGDDTIFGDSRDQPQLGFDNDLIGGDYADIETFKEKFEDKEDDSWKKGDDELYGGGGNDTILGGTGNDELLGGSGIDYLFGEYTPDIDNLDWKFQIDKKVTYDDFLIAEEGNDHLIGGIGNDTLVGGSGSDRFYLNYFETGLLKEGTTNLIDFKVGQFRDEIEDLTSNDILRLSDLSKLLSEQTSGKSDFGITLYPNSNSITTNKYLVSDDSEVLKKVGIEEEGLGIFIERKFYSEGKFKKEDPKLIGFALGASIQTNSKVQFVNHNQGNELVGLVTETTSLSELPQATLDHF